MSSNKGYIKLYRDIRDHWLWSDKPFSRGQAWLDLIMRANREDRTIMFNSTKITVKRGEILTSYTQLADAWGWSRGKVRRFIKILISDNMITQNRHSNGTVFYIDKYRVYQDSATGERTPDGHPADTPRSSDGHKQEYIQEGIREGIKKNPLSPFSDGPDETEISDNSGDDDGLNDEPGMDPEDAVRLWRQEQENGAV